MNKNNLEWYVYYENINSGKIEPVNIFKMFNIEQQVKDYRKHKNPVRFELDVKHELMYHFWSKSEYEIVLKPWIGHGDEKKIDIYDQIMLNWNAFFAYVLFNI